MGSGFKDGDKTVNTANQSAIKDALAQAKETGAPQSNSQGQESNMNQKTENNENKTLQAIMAGLGQSTLTGNAAGGSLAELKENILEALKSDTTNTGLELLIINDSTQLAVPAIILYKKVASKLHYYSIVPEALLFSGKLEPVEEFVNNTKILIDMPASKCYDKDYRSIVSAALTKKLGKLQIAATSFYVISKEKDLKDVLVGKLIVDTAMLAINESFTPSPIVSASILKNAGLKVALHNEVCPNSTVTFADGEPVAADAVICVQASTNANTKGRPNSGGAAVMLSKVAVRFDMFKQDPRQGGQFQTQGQYGTQAPTPAYHPCFIIAASEGLNSTSGSTIENAATHVMGIISTGMLLSGQNFLSVFTQGGKERKNLGLLGYDHNPWNNTAFIPKEIEVENAPQASKEGNLTVAQMAECYFHRNSMTLGMDILQGGRSAWAQRIFLAVANGNKAANAALINIFDVVTEGNFSRLWNQAGGGMLLKQQVCTIHNGTYPHSDGTDHDIREIDYLYMLDLLKEQSSDASVGVGPYASSFVPGATNGADGLFRLHLRRLNILRTTAETAKITGLSERVFFESNVLQIAVAALAASGVKLNPDGLYDQTTTNQLMQGFVPGSMVDYSAAGQVFQQQFTGNNNQNYYTHTSQGGQW